MNEDHQATDPVEEELLRLQPRELSQEFVARLGRQLYDQQPVVDDGEQDSRRRLFRIWVVASGLAVIVLVALTVWLWIPPDGSHVADPGLEKQADSKAAPKGADVAPPPLVDVGPRKMDGSLPTVGNYRNAMRVSPDALDALLQQHADTLMPRSGDHLSLSELIKATSS